MSNLVLAHPSECLLWSMHQRRGVDIENASNRALIASIARTGQLVPTIGRIVARGGHEQIEIVCGARRLMAARQLDIPLKVEVRDLTDRDAFVAMDIENRQRADISSYERGMNYKRWLRGGHFTSQEDIAEALGVSASQVSRLLSLADLPSIVVDAFRSPADLRENWGLKLVELLSTPHKREAVIRTARNLCRHAVRKRGRDVFRELISCDGDLRRATSQAHDRVVCGSDGAALFRIRLLRGAVSLRFREESFSLESIRDIEHTLTTIIGGDLESEACPPCPS